jgi:hypothetical protein
MRVEKSTVKFGGRSFRPREVGECQSVEGLRLKGSLQVLTVDEKENNVKESRTAPRSVETSSYTYFHVIRRSCRLVSSSKYWLVGL